MLMHVAGTFPDNYIYGKCTYYIWEYGEIGKNNTYLCTDHAPQVYIPCRIPCSSLVQYSLNCSLITRYSTNTQLQELATSYQRYACIPPLLLPQFCCYKHKVSKVEDPWPCGTLIWWGREKLPEATSYTTSVYVKIRWCRPISLP